MRYTCFAAVLGMTLLSTAGCQLRGDADRASAADILLASEGHSRGGVFAAIDRARKVTLTNLAAADTTGFKRTVAVADASGVARLMTDFEQGSLKSTGRPFDVAIQGLGFFRVRRPANLGDGYAYTRNGNFFVNNRNELVLGMGDGLRLEAPVSVPMDVAEIHVTQAGVVQVTRAGQAAKETIGQLSLCTFRSPEGLKEIAPAMYAESEASGPAADGRPREDGRGELLQGFLEASNVDIDRERERLAFLREWRAALLESRR